MTTMINVSHVSKTLAGQSVLKNIELSIKKGKTIGIVGSRESGKSVLTKTICGITKPDEGTVEIRGNVSENSIDVNGSIGIFIDSPGYIEIYNGLKNLQFLAAINNKITKNEIEGAMRLVDLNPADKTKVKNYSRGMKLKLGLAQVIMENQDILVLDGLFSSLDYQTNNDLKRIIKKLQNSERTILLTSRHFEDIKEFCDEIFHIEEGELKPLTYDLKSILYGAGGSGK
ncbi:ABC-2 type transport system ATP-binding protein [Sinobaca qinghaiensis]|uniref:ABC-2 type transport system ATP-binding protein n=1 Tax=Sinobaca qinghaiensis TaxID=342944 RepID=A0A419UWS8_9BACL|nr:ABC transporter ATP-binding protein [Sinobaca qinghaiensis]RKD69576.1 ABC-2 type transport system ATP-binding protein [Sinobaca qinghaiensis]